MHFKNHASLRAVAIDMLFRVARGSRNLISKRSVRKGQLKNVSYEIHVKSLRQDCISMIVILVVLFIVHLHHSRSKTCQLTLYTGAPFIMENDYASWTFEIQTQACRRYNLQRREWCEQDAQRFSKTRCNKRKQRSSPTTQSTKSFRVYHQCFKQASSNYAALEETGYDSRSLSYFWYDFRLFFTPSFPKISRRNKIARLRREILGFFC